MEGFDFFGRGRKAGEVVGEAAEERPRIGGGGEGEAGGGEFGEDEGVDGILEFRFGIFDCRAGSG